MNRIGPVYAAHKALRAFVASLSGAERLVLPYMYDLWLRPNQQIPAHDWSTCGMIAGRGFGKTYPIAVEINRRVECGESRAIALMAPTERRVIDVQFKNLIDLAPPWFRPVRHNGGLVWPNGVRALAFTPEAPDRMRSENVDLSWCTELLDWQHTTRREAWENMVTITRTGRAQVLWDTTSKGKNEIILGRETDHERDPRAHVLMRGSTFDNPLLSRKYLKSICDQYTIGSRRYREEILGEVFAESQGALWEQRWLDDHRVAVAPSDPELILVGLDPAMSDHPDADETGIIVGARTRDGHVYLLDDLTGRYKPEVYGDIVVQQCIDHGAAGAVIERARAGDHIETVIRSRALTRGYGVETIEKGKTFPRRKPGKIYLRQIVTATSKSVRAAGPAVETEAGRVHIVGELTELEHEFTTFEPGVTLSPNRYDAAVHLITELRCLLHERQPHAAAVDVADAAEAARVLRTRLAQMGRGRRVGL